MKMRAFVLLFCFSIPLIPSTSLSEELCNSSEAKKSIEKAEEFQKNGNQNSAEKSYFDAIKLCNTGWTWTMLAYFYNSTRQYEKVLKITNGMIRKNFPEEIVNVAIIHNRASKVLGVDKDIPNFQEPPGSVPLDSEPKPADTEEGTSHAFAISDRDLEAAYKNLVITTKDSGTLDCNSKVLQGHEFVLCEYGIGKWSHKGLWMVEGINYYALNGKALTALQKLKGNGSFQELPPRINVNVPAAMSAFENGDSLDVEIVTKAPNSKISDQEIDNYCAYTKAVDQLSIEANSRFGDDPLSKDRETWIEPQILVLQKSYFESRGMTYMDIFSKILDAKIICR